MFEDLASAVHNLQPVMRADLEELVRIDSVSAAGFDPASVRRCAVASAVQLEGAGLHGVRLLEVDGAHPAVYGEIAPPVAGMPTVLLYAHYDVQPAGPEELWSTPPFEPVEIGGRLYGRGTADDKSGIVIHTGAVRAFGARPPVGVKVFLEGEEEVGSIHLDGFLAAYHELLAADAIVVADAGNWNVGTPALTTSLRGLIDCVIEVRTLKAGVHSGMWGGVFPDALSVLVRALSALHDDRGRVAVPGLSHGGRPPVELDEDSAREQAGVLAGVEPIGRGSVTERLWLGPAVSILAIDAPPVAEAINQLLPCGPGQGLPPACPRRRPGPGDGCPPRPSATISAMGGERRPGAGRRRPSGLAGYDRACLRRLQGRIPGGIRAGPGRQGHRGIDPVRTGLLRGVPRSRPVLLTGASDPASYIHGPQREPRPGRTSPKHTGRSGGSEGDGGLNSLDRAGE